MKRTDKFSPVAYFLLFIFINIGCTMRNFIQIAEFKETVIPASMFNASQEMVIQALGKPDRKYTKHDRLEKYNADELWIYRFRVSQGVDEYLYFDNGYLVKWEDLVWGDF